jgi:hypothetical protein
MLRRTAHVCARHIISVVSIRKPFGFTGRLIAAICLTLPLWLTAVFPVAAQSPDDAALSVDAHLTAIKEQEYRAAESMFSESFRAAILPKVKFVNSYLLEVLSAIGRGGWELSKPAALEEERFASVRADFDDVSIYYYLIRQANGWRIEAFSEREYATMADGRRELYLFTNRDWNDDVSKELKCRASLYQIQRELEAYRDEKGEGFYPPVLRGGKSRDALTTWGYFDMETGYPANYFTGRPMEAVDFPTGLRKPSAGNFSYIPVDADGDGNIEGYYLAGWGKPESPNSIFKDTAIVGLLASADERRESIVLIDFIELIKEKYGLDLNSP